MRKKKHHAMAHQKARDPPGTIRHDHDGGIHRDSGRRRGARIQPFHPSGRQPHGALPALAKSDLPHTANRAASGAMLLVNIAYFGWEKTLSQHYGVSVCVGVCVCGII